MTYPHTLPAAPTRTSTCPVAHLHAPQKTTDAVPSNQPLTRDPDGTFHIHDYQAALEVLRSRHTVQAGFNAEQMNSILGPSISPLIYKAGQAHLEQRKRVAKHFTPSVVRTRYRDLTAHHARQVITQLRRDRHGDLSELSLHMAVRVASDVIGLAYTPAMAKRIDAFFSEDLSTFTASPALLARLVRVQWRVANFYFRDVAPAIRARRRNPGRYDDLIASLVEQNVSRFGILCEALTFGSAGMITTREFLSVAAAHLLDPDRAALRDRFLAADHRGQEALLQEILRLEPVVATLYRRTTEAITVGSTTIPSGAPIAIHIDAANVDPAAAGEDSTSLCPERGLSGTQGQLLAFGSGIHACPGGAIALQEAVVLLDGLLRLPGIRMARQPTIGRDPFTTGYIVRDLMVTCE